VGSPAGGLATFRLFTTTGACPSSRDWST